MAHHHPSASSFSDFTISVGHDSEAGDADVEWPFGRIDAVDRGELRETAYEIFFASCRSSPGFGGRNPLSFYPSNHHQPSPEGGNTAATSGTGIMVVNSRIKRALGLRTRRGSPPMRVMSAHSSSPVVSVGGAAGASSPGAGRLKQRPMTSAEIMRQQMGVTEQSDNRLRKTIMRTLVGQAAKRAETIILPLELLRHLKPSEFSDAQEYHQWQRRQLKILEAGLLHHPSIPLDRLNSSALRLREVIRSGELKPIDNSKNSESLKALCNAVVSLAWRNSNGSPAEACHWADGFPLNIHLYISLLRSIFDLRDETVVLEEVDELIELMKKTWITLGINKMTHNVCLAWTMFEQYVKTGQIEQDLLGASLIILGEIATEAKKEAEFLKVLSPVMSSMLAWAERKLLDYHTVFRGKCSVALMEKVLSLALTTAKIMNDDQRNSADEDGNGEVINSAVSPIERYIKSSLKSAFTKILENGNGNVDSMVVEVDEEPSETLVHLAKDTETLVALEKETYSPVLQRWHPGSMAVAVATLHSCYGIVLKQYLARIPGLKNETVRVLQTAGKLEKTLVQMVVEDSANCDDGGKAIVREMVLYDVDSIILSLMKNWITGRLRIGRECFSRAKETETWNRKSKSEPYAQSAVDLMKLAKVTVDEFFEIPVAAREELVQELADGLENLFQDYTSFVASCGTKQSYIPNLPPLTRCNQDSRFTTLWKKAQALIGLVHPKTRKKPTPAESHHPRPSTSRATQRFYIRLNSLHYVLAVLHSIDKSLSFFGRNSSRSPHPRLAGPGSTSRRRIAPTCFDLARSSLQSAIFHVSEVAAYRLIFVDSHQAFYQGLYAGGVAAARIRPSLRLLKQNLNFIVTILTDRAQPVAVREVMKAALEAFLMVLLAGGSERAFGRGDSEMVAEDLESLRRVFCTSGEGLVAEEVVEKEMEVAEGIVALMALPTEKLLEEFTTVACEASGIGAHKVPMPPTTGKWNRSDPNTILRVICHRDDEVANRFLKRTFQMAKRK
ncbi:protein unc-13 homolog [Dendrobium catenatum]|uniref:protein unc-13 homolog n=1 Tax=Dendrobium catenatum TaxID=906689 RepID=UPI0009F618D1|nr:protein unc-13 homolog [Dendrobium catenatum]